LTSDVPGRPDQGRRATKAERKEQARREREALQRRLASKKRKRTLAAVVVGGGVAVAALAVAFLPSGAGSIPTPDDLLQRSAQAAEAAGCGDVTTTPPFDPVDQDRTHVGGGDVAGPPLSAYPTIPPASGPHADVPLSAGVYDTVGLSELYRSIHSLEHGAAVIWFDQTAPAGRVSELLAFYDRRLQDAQVGQDRVIVAPYDFASPGGVLPDGSQMALVAWHRLRTCASVDLAVAFDFTSQYTFPTSAGRDYLGEAPEPGGAI
jgi:hypothetical protein